MPSQAVIASGACIAFSAVAPATFDETGFAALTWTGDWQEVTALGSVGPTATITEYKTQCDGVVNKRAGSKNYGTMSIEAGNVETDENQQLLQTAVDAVPISPVYVRLTLPTGALRYFKAFPASLTDDIPDPDSIFMTSCELAIDGSWVRVAA